MRNRYPGQCYRCGERVEAGEGHFEQVSIRTMEKLGLAGVKSRWLVQHAECAIKYRGTDHTYWKEENEDDNKT